MYLFLDSGSGEVHLRCHRNSNLHQPRQFPTLRFYLQRFQGYVGFRKRDLRSIFKISRLVVGLTKYVIRHIRKFPHHMLYIDAVQRGVQGTKCYAPRRKAVQPAIHTSAYYHVPHSNAHNRFIAFIDRSYLNVAKCGRAWQQRCKV